MTTKLTLDNKPNETVRGVHRIRHYGLFANGNRAASIARARQLLPRQPT